MDVSHAEVGVDSYFHPLLVPFLLSSALVAVCVGVQACNCPAMKCWRFLKGKNSVFLTFQKKAAGELEME